MSQPTISFLGCGWLGLPLADLFFKKGWLVSASTTSSNKESLFKKHGFTPYNINIYKEYSTDSNFWQSDILCITIPFKRSLIDPWIYPSALEKVLICASFSKIKHILFTSSTSIYSNTFEECDEKAPIGESERSKALYAAENTILKEKKISSTILRLAGLIGPERQPGKFWRNNKLCQSPNQPVNLVHLEDVIAIIEKIIDKNKWGYIFNVATDGHPLKKDFYTRESKKIGKPVPSFASTSDTDAKKVVLNKYLKKELSFDFKHKLKE
ncbi:hypothetical protein AB834_00800 [PVC group bacterium (ex Bugula neritina AB1)]|nr:hypothetical protein AB834_00800 [PVC group bacterium (ex Bugula neritina AB1)]